MSETGSNGGNRWSLTGTAALVTGGTRGIGLSFVSFVIFSVCSILSFKLDVCNIYILVLFTFWAGMLL